MTTPIEIIEGYKGRARFSTPTDTHAFRDAARELTTMGPASLDLLGVVDDWDGFVLYVMRRSPLAAVEQPAKPDLAFLCRWHRLAAAFLVERAKVPAPVAAPPIVTKSTRKSRSATAK